MINSNNSFSHIYVEKSVYEHPNTTHILSEFSGSKIILINNYKDLFNRKNQNKHTQGLSQNIILARKTSGFLYPGAPVCQSFGNPYFFYSSNIMNCLFDCSYCFLKGMYQSRNIVIFVNIEDTFNAVMEMKKIKNPLYISVSYDTDLIAANGILPLDEMWQNFAASNHDISIEIRTKCGISPHFKKLLNQSSGSSATVFAFTISPQNICSAFEKKTANLYSRIDAINYAFKCNVPVRLCFDPMIYTYGWRDKYLSMLEILDSKISWESLNDVSIGSFRVSKEYLSEMRKCEPSNQIVQFPFETLNGYASYPAHIRSEMESFLMTELSKRLPVKKIFIW